MCFSRIGYALSQKGYRCLHLPTNKIDVSRHVIFDEGVFPFQHATASSDSFNGSDPPAPQQLLSVSPLLVRNPAGPHTSSSETSPTNHVLAT